jgi:GxxExxY protein
MADELTKDIIGAAIEVHQHLGPGLLESIYEAALCHELNLRPILYEKQKRIEILYKSVPIKGQRIDLVVENKVILELKAVSRITPFFISQTLSYLKAAKIRKALIINFNTRKLTEGIKRVSL